MYIKVDGFLGYISDSQQQQKQPVDLLNYMADIGGGNGDTECLLLAEYVSPGFTIFSQGVPKMYFLVIVR